MIAKEIVLCEILIKRMTSGFLPVGVIPQLGLQLGERPSDPQAPHETFV